MKAPIIHFRKCKPSQLHIAKSLDKKLFSKDEVRDFSEDEIWIGWHNDTPIAYCSVKYVDLPDNKFAFLSRAGVLTKYRGKGLQKRMIRLRVRDAKRRGFNFICTYTVMCNYASSNNLISCGFKLYDPETNWAGKWVLYWQRTLVG
jgi:hypothetical protein